MYNVNNLTTNQTTNRLSLRLYNCKGVRPLKTLSDMITNLLGIPSIDSLKLSFELSLVKILNNNLLDHVVNLKVNTVTGEVINEKPIQSNSLVHEYEDYNIHFAINNSFGKEKLVVLANSKLLEYNYMRGI